MNEKLKLVKINSEYCDYLRRFDKRVPYNFDKYIDNTTKYTYTFKQDSNNNYLFTKVEKE